MPTMSPKVHPRGFRAWFLVCAVGCTGGYLKKAQNGVRCGESGVAPPEPAKSLFVGLLVVGFLRPPVRQLDFEERVAVLVRAQLQRVPFASRWSFSRALLTPPRGPTNLVYSVT